MIDSKELNKLNTKLNKIGKELIKSVDVIPDEITKELAIGANDIRNTIIKSMKKTDRAPWFYWRRKKPGRIKHNPSAPGSPPAIDSGELVRSIMFDARELEVEIGAEAGAPYAAALEDGATYKDGHIMAARPWLAPAVEKHQKGIIAKVGKGVFEIIENSFSKV